MKEYHKIQTVFLRDLENKYKTLLEGQFTLPEFEYLANNEWVFTEKVDGTNIRAVYSRDEIIFCGKTDDSQVPSFLFNKLQRIFTPQKEKLAEMFPDGVCLYGEGYGNKIQRGRNYSEEQDFVLFDVKVGGFWLKRPAIEDIATNLGMKVVPIIGIGTLYEMVELVRKGFDSTWGNFKAEGIVARPSVELFARNGERIITKIKTRDFKRS